MSDKKLTDNEIIKALEKAEYRCDGIELRGFYLDHESMKQVIDLINRLQAENERLKGKVKGFEKIRRAYQRMIHESMPNIQAALDNVLKELVGE